MNQNMNELLKSLSEQFGQPQLNIIIPLEEYNDLIRLKQEYHNNVEKLKIAMDTLEVISEETRAFLSGTDFVHPTPSAKFAKQRIEVIEKVGK